MHVFIYYAPLEQQKMGSHLTSHVWVLQTICTGYRINFTRWCCLTRLHFEPGRAIVSPQRWASRKYLKNKQFKLYTLCWTGSASTFPSYKWIREAGGPFSIQNLLNSRLSIRPSGWTPSNQSWSFQESISTCLRHLPCPVYRYVGSLSRFRGCLLSRCDGTVYQLKVIPFCLSTVPRTFTHQDVWIKSVPLT